MGDNFVMLNFIFQTLSRFSFSKMNFLVVLIPSDVIQWMGSGFFGSYLWLIYRPRKEEGTENREWEKRNCQNSVIYDTKIASELCHFFRIYYTFQIEGIFFFLKGLLNFMWKNSQSGTIAIFTISSKCPEGRDVGTVSRVMFNLRFVTQYEQTAATLDILYSWYSENNWVSIK